MTVRIAKTSGWYDPDFQPYEIDDHGEQIAELQLSGTKSLMDFIRNEGPRPTSQEFHNLGNRKYLTQLEDGTWQLQVVDRDAIYISKSKQELLAISEKL
jgi:hypothetical protein